MARINLLPWREELRKEKQQNFLVTLISVVLVTGVIMAGVHFYYVDRIDYQNTRNAYLNKEIKSLDTQIKEIRDLEDTKKKLQAQLDIIQTLQSSRPEVVHLFDQLVKTLPEGVYLTSVRQTGNKLVVQGIAQSNARVSSYMWNIDKSDWLANPKLDVINTKGSGNERLSNFTLNVMQSRKQPNDAEKKK